MGLFDFLKKNKKNNDNDFVKENWREIVPYWGSVIAGDIKLEDGSKFDTDVIYNTKFLKYKKRDIEIASLLAAKSTDNEDLKDNIRTCYMWLANFSDHIKDKYVTDTKKMKDLVTKEKNSEELIKKIAKLDYDEKKANTETVNLNKAYMEMVKKFDNLLGKK